MPSLKEKADYEAKVSLIQMGVRKYNDTVFSAPSFTSNTDHIVTVIDGVVTFCSKCQGFETHGHCSHGEAVLRYIMEEQEQVKAATPALPAPTSEERRRTTTLYRREIRLENGIIMR